MDRNDRIIRTLRELGQQSPAGFAMALHVRFVAPKYLFQSYPTEWMDYYSANGLVLQDPTVRWGFENAGFRRWSALEADDPAGVIARARGHGLGFGVTVAMLESGSRSVASFARNDREFTDEEIVGLADRLSDLHEATAELEELSPEMHRGLHRMSILLTHT